MEVSTVLHVMNDRKVVATVEVGDEGVSAAFKRLMDLLIADIDENYSTDHFDVSKIISKIMKGDARRARDADLSIEEMSSFLTGDPEKLQHEYSVVVQHKH